MSYQFRCRSIHTGQRQFLHNIPLVPHRGRAGLGGEIKHKNFSRPLTPLPFAKAPTTSLTIEIPNVEIALDLN